MVTIFKNATNLLIVLGEWWMYSESVSTGGERMLICMEVRDVHWR
jgi:hypothetical protein